jgi:hypothetical protein
MQTMKKFKAGDKVVILDKNYGCTFREVKPNIKLWQGEYGIGWVISVYENFYVVGYTKDTIAGDFFRQSDLRHFTVECLGDELFEI